MSFRRKELDLSFPSEEAVASPRHRQRLSLGELAARTLIITTAIAVPLAPAGWFIGNKLVDRMVEKGGEEIDSRLDASSEDILLDLDKRVQKFEEQIEPVGEIVEEWDGFSEDWERLKERFGIEDVPEVDMPILDQSEAAPPSEGP